ncbi:MAG: serine protease [Calditrichaeota bacterium]|nr:MAG: serine protease [Calditrichota bacterium]
MAGLKIDLEGEWASMAKTMETEQEALLGKDNVVGIGLGPKLKDEKETGDNCISVMVSHKLDPSMVKSDDMIPPTLGKFKTDVIETGEIFAGALSTADTAKVEQLVKDLMGNQDLATREAPATPYMLDQAEEMMEEELRIETLRNRVRPAQGGFSVGHFRVTAGTIATAVIDRAAYPGMPRRYYILSNNHVLANSNNARVGDPIVQPGTIDGGRLPRDIIGRLSRWVNIRFRSGSSAPRNYVDAAIAEVQFHDIGRDVYWIGYADGLATVRPGDIVQKTGRTTNYTTGRVRLINATVNVNYGGGRSARFVRQIITTRMSSGGDSGSLLFNMSRKAVGLLFAGSSSITVFNDIRYVRSLLGIHIA